MTVPLNSLRTVCNQISIHRLPLITPAHHIFAAFSPEAVSVRMSVCSFTWVGLECLAFRIFIPAAVGVNPSQVVQWTSMD